MLEKLSGILGGRTREIVTGGAPTSPEVLKFLNRCFDCHIRESYGATEVGGIASEGFISAGEIRYTLVYVSVLSLIIIR